MTSRKNRRSRCVLISISGMDNAGKSTQIELLKQHFACRGQATVVLWHRPGYSETLNTLRSGIRRLLPSALPTKDQRAARERAFGRSWIKQLWLLMALVDTFIQYALKVRYRLARGFTIICDRHLEDAILDMEINFPDDLGLTRRVWPLVRAASRQADYRFLLVIPWDISRTRAERKNEPFPDTPDASRRRYNAYQRMAAGNDFHVIDASLSLEVVQHQIVQLIELGGGNVDKTWN